MKYPIGMQTFDQIIERGFVYVDRRCVKMRTSFFYAQSPDFHKLGLCYYLKILYL